MQAAVVCEAVKYFMTCGGRIHWYYQYFRMSAGAFDNLLQWLQCSTVPPQFPCCTATFLGDGQKDGQNERRVCIDASVCICVHI